MIKVKSWVHTGLAVRDLSQAIAFYETAFGYKVVFSERGISQEIADITGIPGQICDLAQLRNPHSDHILELLRFHGFDSSSPTLPEAPLRPGQGHIAFQVENLETAIDYVRSLGAALVGQIARFPEGRAVYMREPGGTYFELDEMEKSL